MHFTPMWTPIEPPNSNALSCSRCSCWCHWSGSLPWQEGLRTGDFIQSKLDQKMSAKFCKLKCHVMLYNKSLVDHHVSSLSPTKKNTFAICTSKYLLFRDTNLSCSVTPLTTPPKSVWSAESLMCKKTPGACSKKRACNTCIFIPPIGQSSFALPVDNLQSPHSQVPSWCRSPVYPAILATALHEMWVDSWIT